MLSAENEGWIHYLTCLSQEVNQDSEGNARININRANQQALTQQLGLSAGQARWVTENRPFRRLADMIGQTATTGRAAQTAQPAQQTPPAGRQAATPGQQQEPPPAEPLDAATVLGIADKITLTNRRTVTGKLNVNTAGLVVLTALFEGNRELAENVIAAREGLGGVFLSLEDLQQVEGMTQDMMSRYLDQITIRSSIFEIHATAVSQATEQRYKIEAIVNREASQGQITYWREGIGR